MKTIFPIIQIAISIFLIVFILFQQRGTALGASFGGGGGFYASRRGIEKKIFWATIICGAIFIILALTNLLL